jgi:hypothetical protein
LTSFEVIAQQEVGVERDVIQIFFGGMEGYFSKNIKKTQSVFSSFLMQKSAPKFFFSETNLDPFRLPPSKRN